MHVIEDRFDALLALGQSSELVPELEGVLTGEPFRERLWGQLMLALYRSGRQADALRAYQRAPALADELGIEPGPALRDLEAGDPRPGRHVGSAAAAVATPDRRAPGRTRCRRGHALVGRRRRARPPAPPRGTGARSGHGGFVAWSGRRASARPGSSSALAAQRTPPLRSSATPGATPRTARPGRCSTRRCARPARRCSRRSPAAMPGESLGAASPGGWPTGPPVRRSSSSSTTSTPPTTKCSRSWPRSRAPASRRRAPRRGGLPHRAATTRRVRVGRRTSRSCSRHRPRRGRAESAALYGDDWTTAEVDRLYAGDLRDPPRRARGGRRVGDARSGAADSTTPPIRPSSPSIRLLQSQQAVADEVVGIQRLVEQRRRSSPARRRADHRDRSRVCSHSSVEDAPWFFGRERLVAELAARLATRPVLAVVGASGSGKSSLVRAGLLPALAAGSLPGQRALARRRHDAGASPTGRPRPLSRGASPPAGRGCSSSSTSWRSCSPTATTPPSARSSGRSSRSSSTMAPRSSLRCGRPDGTVERGSEPRAPAARQRRARRSDPGARAARRHRAAGAARRPAARAGPRRADPRRRPGLVGVLPLLQTALLATWERRTGNVLTLGAYQASGGVQGAVARLAETTYERPRAGSAAGRRPRRILLRLAEASDDGTLDLRRRVRVDDIASRDDADARVAYEEMVRHRLLTSRRTPSR